MDEWWLQKEIGFILGANKPRSGGILLHTTLIRFAQLLAPFGRRNTAQRLVSRVVARGNVQRFM